MSVTDEIKSRLDLVDIVQGTVPLKKAGRNYKGVCPFHSDKTPSFVVFPDTQTWHCFGACGEGGDLFSFVMKQEGLDFNEAMKQLAEQAGVELEPPSPERSAARESRDRLRAILSLAADYFHTMLLDAPQAGYARDYVAQRGLSTETLAQFQVGYAPDSWDATRQVVLAEGYEVDDLLQAGLLVENDAGDTYDRFRNRLMIPIRDARGRVIGFGARALAPDAVPKYLNSPQSPLFDKSSVLFGLSEARREIRGQDTVVIVEGYMDVMQAHQAGFMNVVAQMGTALTEPQLKALRRHAGRFVLALDSDTAGARATMRGLDTARAALDKQVSPALDARGMVTYEGHLDAQIDVLLVPDGMDPDDVIRESPERWAALLEEAIPVTEYALQVAIQGRDLDDAKVKKQIVREIGPLIDDIADATERDHYRQRLARLLKIDERVMMVTSAGTAIRARVRSRKQVEEEPAEPEETLPEGWFDVRAGAQMHEGRCLVALLHRPRLAYKADRLFRTVKQWPDQGVWDGLSVQDFAQAEHRIIYQSWRGALLQTDQAPIDKLRGSLDEALLPQLDYLLEAHHSTMMDIGEKKLEDEILSLLVKMRDRRLMAELKQLELLALDDHENGDLTASSYQDTIMSYIVARQGLLRLEVELQAAGRRIADSVQV